jgi:RHS repeat-associated protein
MKLSIILVPFFCYVAVASPGLYAQVGNDNPTGPSGEFNGNVTTGGLYDPYTANATRALTDMVVAGAVGKYGLTYSRVWNTRTPAWQFSHNWGIEVDGVPGQYETYYVTFPDGRRETFTHSTSDVDFRAAPGTRERMQRWAPTTGDFGSCYLKLPDGGKIEFSGTRTWHHDGELIPPSWYEWNLTATAMIDPYGQRTTYAPNTDGSLQITEPAGRWIKVYYVTSGDAMGNVDYIQASDGRVVDYTWQTQYFGIPSLPYVVLTSVSYYGDASLTATYTYRMGNVGKQGCALETCDDPMYPGPMKRIKYIYQNANNPDGSARVVGQIKSETNAATGDVVSTLTVTGPDTRVETRGDGRQRTLTYAGGYLVSWTDFKSVPSYRTYDTNKYVDSVTDGRGNTTNLTHNPFTGVVTQVQYPLTLADTPPGTPRGTVIDTYGGGDCQDPNNQDSNNQYYLCSTKDEANNVTRFTRDSNKRVTRIDYADGGYETFSYNSFGQVLSHQMKTGGIESFTYDGRGLRQTYRGPDNASGNPTACYQYDALDRVSGVTDVFASYPGDPYHTTNYQYNSRGQVAVTTLPLDPVDFSRHTIVKSYNPNGDGTLLSATDQLGHTTSYTYDDYRRLRTMTTPLRAPGDSTARTTYYSYHRNQVTGDDYTHTDSNVTLLTLPSTNIVKAIYDENYRKSSVTTSAGSGSDAATISYGYDNGGNLTSMLLPDEQPGQINQGKSTTRGYDERNRLMTAKDPLNYYTYYTYDSGGRKKTITQPNGRVITYNLYDSMNRVLQQTATQTPGPVAVTQYTYDPSGLHMTMQDPHLVEISSSHVYAYEYDQMGRAKSVTYPPDSLGVSRTELYTYDIGGRLGTYTNRDGKVQTFTYDNLYRQTAFTWSAGSAPNVSFGYDPANRVTSISNANAVISRTYFDDNLLKTEAETVTGGVANTVAYAWNADARRESIQYPSGKWYGFDYTGRNQLRHVQDKGSFLYQAEYVYDVNGSVATRKVGVDVGSFSVTTDASARDALGQCTHLEHQFPSGSGGARTFDYVLNAMGNHTSIQRDGGTAESYGYDQAQQVTAGIDSGNAHTYGYDANGNRTSDNGGGTFTTNSLNQQTTFNGQTVGHDNSGNVNSRLVSGILASYVYDAQNRLVSVSVGGTTTTFQYDGLNRKVSQTVAGTTTYNVWDAWNLIEERNSGNALVNTYIYGAGEIIERIASSTSYFYYQDHLGSTSHLADASGALLESYKYSTFGQPAVYAPGGSVRKGGSAYDARHLFTGQLWMPATGLYDYRNRVFSPDLTRFLQPDPIGFSGDPSNLYRYCGNNAVNGVDPLGMVDHVGDDDLPWVLWQSDNGVIVYGSPDFGGTNNALGWRDVSSLGGLDNLGQGGGLHGGTPFGFGPSGGFSLGALPLNPFSPPTLPINPFGPTASSAPNITTFIGANVSVIPFAGGTLSLGIYFSPQGVGIYGTQGVGTGLDVSVSGQVGYVKDTTIDGPFTNTSFGILKFGGTSFELPSGQVVGYGINFGPGLTPLSGSITNTNTYITSPEPGFVPPMVWHQ